LKRSSPTADPTRTDWRGVNLDDEDFGRRCWYGYDFRGASLRCSRLAWASFPKCRFDGADIRLAHIKSRSDLWWRRKMLSEQGALQLSRKALGLELLKLSCTRLHDLQELAEQLTEKRFALPAWVSRDSVLAATMAAAQEHEPNPVARDLTWETRRVAQLPFLPEFAAPYLLQRNADYGH